MANYKATSEDLASVADRIRAKTGDRSPLVWPDGYKSAVDSIPTYTLRDILIDRNGTVSPGAGEAFSTVTVSVANSYGPEDAGKAVGQNAQGRYELLDQGSAVYDSNGVRDTTYIGQVTVENCYEPFVTASDFQTIVKNGNGPRRFPVWSRLRIPYGSGTETVQVVSYDTDRDKNDPAAHTVTLLWLNGFSRQRFCAVQKFAHFSEALPTGRYHFKVQGSSSTRSITLRSVTPAGGYMMFDDDSAQNITTYDASGTMIEQDYASLTNVGADLKGVSGVLLNGTEAEGYWRAFNGSGNYPQSPLRQWLNASGSGWYIAQTAFDLAPDFAANPGFLTDFDPAWLAVLKRTDQVTAHNAVFETDLAVNGSSVTDDLIFLPGMTQLGLGQNNGVSEGTPWTAFDGTGASRGAIDRIKCDSALNSIAYWWSRSCVAANTWQVRDGLQFSGLTSEHKASSGTPMVCPCFVV